MKCNGCNYPIEPVYMEASYGYFIICPNGKCGQMSDKCKSETDVLSSWNYVNLYGKKNE